MFSLGNYFIANDENIFRYDGDNEYIYLNKICLLEVNMGWGGWGVWNIGCICSG